LLACFRLIVGKAEERRMILKKILVVSPSCFPGTKGDAINYLEMIQGLVRMRIKIVLICPKSPRSNSFDEEMRKKGIAVFRIPLSPPRQEELGERQFIVSSVIRLILFYVAGLFTTLAVVLLESDAKHVIIRHGVQTINFPPLLGILGRTRRITSAADGTLISSFASIGAYHAPKTLFRILSFYEMSVMKFYTRFPNFVFGNLISDLALTPSQIERITRVSFPKSGTNLKSIGMNTERIPVHGWRGIPKNTFGLFGTLEKWGNVDLLLRAWAKVVERKPDARLLIIGDGSIKNDLKRLAGDLQIMKSVIFLDAVPRDVLWHEYFKLFRVAIVPRSSKLFPENASVKLVEALAAGKPVIASRVPGITSEVGEEDGVVFAEPDNEESLVFAINRLLDNDRAISALSEKALKASHRFSVDSQLERLVGIWRDRA
jgi:glycosyltransferase involved in cell wall biosynthesis